MSGCWGRESREKVLGVEGAAWFYRLGAPGLCPLSPPQPGSWRLGSCPLPPGSPGSRDTEYRRRALSPFSQDQETRAWRLDWRLEGTRPGHPAAPGARPDAGEPARPAAGRPHGHRLPELEATSRTPDSASLFLGGRVGQAAWPEAQAHLEPRS